MYNIEVEDDHSYLANFVSVGNCQNWDISQEAKKFVKESHIKNGLVNIQILHTLVALIVNEYEPLLLEDIKNALEKCSPKSQNYQHDNLSKRTVNICPGECVNGHSHCKAIHLPVNATLNIIEGGLRLGKLESIMLVELDHSKSRKVQIQIIGE